MKKDLCVEEIVNVYRQDTTKWKRDASRERNREGLVLFTEGEIEYTFPSETVLARRGSLMLFPSNLPYCGVARTERVAYFVLDFKSVGEDGTLALGAPCIAVPQNFEELCRAFDEVERAWERQSAESNLLAKAFLYKTLAQMVGGGKHPTGGDDRGILPYLFDHYTDPALSVSSLCREFFISESQLRRNILRATGLTPNEYITSLRLTRAKRELICTQKRILDIASECGFSSAYYFSRCFHRHTGVSPEQYRQSNRSV